MVIAIVIMVMSYNYFLLLLLLSRKTHKQYIRWDPRIRSTNFDVYLQIQCFQRTEDTILSTREDIRSAIPVNFHMEQTESSENIIQSTNITNQMLMTFSFTHVLDKQVETVAMPNDI